MIIIQWINCTVYVKMGYWRKLWRCIMSCLSDINSTWSTEHSTKLISLLQALLFGIHVKHDGAKREFRAGDPARGLGKKHSLFFSPDHNSHLRCSCETQTREHVAIVQRCLGYICTLALWRKSWKRERERSEIQPKKFDTDDVALQRSV